MENSVTWYDMLIKTLDEKYPKRSELIQALVDLLCIEREAVYRRLRKDVSFSIYEIVKISSTWNISLDKITGLNSGQVPFFMQPMNYIEPSKQESKFLRHVIQSISFLKNFPDTEFMDVSNKLPRKLLAGYKYLDQFYLFKWKYLYSHEKKPLMFSQVIVSEEKRQLTAEYYKAIKNVPKSTFILDHHLFDYLVRDVQYFNSIQMINDDERELIKKDLYDLLDYLQEIATHACYPETQNKVNIFISQLNIDTNYSYTYTHKNHVNICFIHVFDKFEVHTFESEMVSNFIKWMQLRKRTSINITGVDEKSRIEYFTRQRKLVETL